MDSINKQIEKAKKKRTNEHATKIENLKIIIKQRKLAAYHRRLKKNMGRMDVSLK